MIRTGFQIIRYISSQNKTTQKTFLGSNLLIFFILQYYEVNNTETPESHTLPWKDPGDAHYTRPNASGGGGIPQPRAKLAKASEIYDSLTFRSRLAPANYSQGTSQLWPPHYTGI